MSFRFYAPILLLPLVTACTTNNPADFKPATTVTTKQESLKRLAEATRAAGDMQATIDLYEQAARLAPNDIAPQLELARTYLAVNNYSKAITTLQKAESIDPNHSERLLLLAQAYISDNKPGRALAPLEQGLTPGAPDERKFLTYKGIALDMLNRYSDAQAAYKEALVIAPPEENIAIRNNLAMSYLMDNRTQEAIKIWQDLLGEGHDNPTIRQNLAMAYGMTGDDEMALQLGLQDLPEKEAKENVNFLREYRKLAP
jgi:Flp pilus assembly protein TadD